MAQKLKLHSPVGAEPLILKWPVATSEGKEGPEEIVDTISLVCEDFPELKALLESKILKAGEEVSSYDFEQTKGLCDRYNKAIDSIRQQVKSSTRQRQFNKRPSMTQLKHILQQCYNHSVTDPEKLNHYEPFSPEVYGETSFELVEQMIKSVKFTENDYFIDLGSGVGQVILQVSAATNCKFCYGIEKAEWPAEYAVGMEREFHRWMKWFGKEQGDFLIQKGDFLHDDIKEKLKKATIVFVNNFAFGPVVDHELKQRFANCLKEGARIVSSKAFCPLNFRITERNLSDIGTIMTVEELSPLCGAVSWTGKPFAYYVHTIDRTLLEKYFQRLKNPAKRDDLEPRKDRKGRPVLSIKDKINGALSAGSDSNSNGRWRRVRGLQREIDSSPSLMAAKVLDFDSASNSSSTNSTPAVAVVEENGIVYGPTTRRQWNEYVKKPQSQSGTENDNDSSTADAMHDTKTKEVSKQLRERKKRMKTVKRLNNGALGMRKMQAGKKIEESTIVKSKAAVKLRPRLSRTTEKNGSSPPAPVTPAAGHSTTAQATSSSPVSLASSTATSQPLDSLNLLHAHTIMSTSGKATDPSEKVCYNDKRMTETSSAYFKPTVQQQTVSMLEKQAGVLQYFESFKQNLLSFLAFMQTPQYRTLLLLQLEQEKCKSAELLAKTEGLEKEISILQKDGVKLIKDRLKEMGIKADTPRELISQAKDIVLQHHELKSQTASLGAQINALQAEHNQKITAYKNIMDRKVCARQNKNGFTEHANLVLDKDLHEQRKLLADVDRLYTELQYLQDVNRKYTSHLDHNLNQNEKPNGVCRSVDYSHLMKEKKDMKENYDTFDEVLVTLKKEVTTALHNSTAKSPAVKGKVDASVKQDLDRLSGTKGNKVLSMETLQKQINGVRDMGLLAMTSSASHSQPLKAAKEMIDEPKPQVSISSPWVTETRGVNSVSNATSLILPPGTKIDIKKGSKPIGIKKLLRGKFNESFHFTQPQNSETANNPSATALYTDIEKSAAEDLISLKESISSPNKDKVQPLLNFPKHITTVQRIHSSSEPAVSVQKKGSSSFGSKNNIHRKDSAKGAITCSISDAVAHVSKTSQPLANTVLPQGLIKQSLCSTSTSSEKSVPSMSIMCNLPLTNGYLKHKSSEIAFNPPAKIRSIDSRMDVKTPTSSAIQYSQNLRFSQPPTSNLAQILNSGTEQSRVISSASASHVRHIVGSAGSRGAGSVPYVTIQSPHVSAVPSSQAANGFQPALLKILQQPLMLPSKSGALMNGSGTNGVVATSLAQANLNTINTSETLGHAVKFLPSNGMDGKGCLQSPLNKSLVLSESDTVVDVGLTECSGTALKRQSCSKGDTLESDLYTLKRQTRSARLYTSLALEPLAKVSKLAEDYKSDSACDLTLPGSDLEVPKYKSKKSLAVLLKRESKLEKMAEINSEAETTNSPKQSLAYSDDTRLDRDMSSSQTTKTFTYVSDNSVQLTKDEQAVDNVDNGETNQERIEHKELSKVQTQDSYRSDKSLSAHKTEKRTGENCTSDHNKSSHKANADKSSMKKQPMKADTKMGCADQHRSNSTKSNRHSSHAKKRSSVHQKNSDSCHSKPISSDRPSDGKKESRNTQKEDLNFDKKETQSESRQGRHSKNYRSNHDKSKKRVESTSSIDKSAALKVTRNISSSKQRELSPGPPKLERAINSPILRKKAVSGQHEEDLFSTLHKVTSGSQKQEIKKCAFSSSSSNSHPKQHRSSSPWRKSRSPAAKGRLSVSPHHKRHMSDSPYHRGKHVSKEIVEPSRSSRKCSEKNSSRSSSRHSSTKNDMLENKKSKTQAQISILTSCEEKVIGDRNIKCEQKMSKSLLQQVDSLQLQQVDSLQSKQEMIDQTLMQLSHLDSPDSLLTPQSMSMNGDTDSLDVMTSCSEYESSIKDSLTRCSNVMPDNGLNSKTVRQEEKDSPSDVERFSLPLTPQKTPNSSPNSPFIDSTSTEELKQSPPDVTSSLQNPLYFSVKTPADNCPPVVPVEVNVKKGPHTPPGSPVLSHQSRSRYPSVSSSSSRGSSYDSSSSSTSSSDSSSDDTKKKKHRRRRVQVKKTPPRKLSTLNPPINLSIGSPPIATVQYSPMPSASVGGLNYNQLRMSMVPGCALSPLSVSTQQSPGYQMVTSETLRSPNSMLKSPGGSCLQKQQYPLLCNPLLSPTSAAPSPTQVYQSANNLGKDSKTVIEPTANLHLESETAPKSHLLLHCSDITSSRNTTAPFPRPTSLDIVSTTNRDDLSLALQVKNPTLRDFTKDHNANNTSFVPSNSITSALLTACKYSLSPNLESKNFIKTINNNRMYTSLSPPSISPESSVGSVPTSETTPGDKLQVINGRPQPSQLSPTHRLTDEENPGNKQAKQIDVVYSSTGTQHQCSQPFSKQAPMSAVPLNSQPSNHHQFSKILPAQRSQVQCAPGVPHQFHSYSTTGQQPPNGNRIAFGPRGGHHHHPPQWGHPPYPHGGPSRFIKPRHPPPGLSSGYLPLPDHAHPGMDYNLHGPMDQPYGSDLRWILVMPKQGKNGKISVNSNMSNNQ